MKKLFFYALMFISLLLIFDININDNINEVNNDNKFINKEEEVTVETEKLVFEISDQDINTESTSKEITKKFKEAGDYVTVAVELEDDFDEFIEEPQYSITVEEAQEIVKEQRDMVKAHYTEKNERLVQKLGLGFMEADVEISRYSNFVFLNY